MYNNTLVNSCLSYLGAPIKQGESIKWFVDQFCKKDIDYLNDVETRLVDVINGKENARELYFVIKSRIIDKATRSINNINFSNAYYGYKNDIVFLEKEILRTKDYERILG